MSKREKAERLYGAIGELDDIFIHEAIAYKKKRFSFSVQRLSLVLTAILICVASVFIIRSGLIEYDKDDGSSDTPNNGTSEYVLTLDSVLADAEGEYFFSESEIDLFDGSVKFICYDGEKYKAVRVFESPLNIVGAMSFASSQDMPEPKLKVWLCDGNGLVVTPYLKQSQGNIGYNTLFDYIPEGIPSAEFSEYVNRIV